MKKKRRRSNAQRAAALDELNRGGGSDEEILTAISAEALLFHTPSRESFASVPVGGAPGELASPVEGVCPLAHQEVL